MGALLPSVIFNVWDYDDDIQATADAAFVNGGGKVYAPVGTYRFEEPLVFQEYVTLLGDTVESTPHAEGTKFIFDPPAPTSEAAITFKSSPSFPLTYLTPSIGFFGLSGGVNAQGPGIHLINCRASMNDVDIRLFYSGPGLKVEGGINSRYQNVLVSHCDVGVEVGGSGMLSTTITFASSYFTHCRRAADVSNANSVRFTDWSVFESTAEHGLVANDVNMLDLDSCYWENVAGSLVRVGELARVDNLMIRGGHAVSGVNNDPLFDAIYIDDNRLADVSLVSCIVPKASFVHLASGSGQLIVEDPNYQSTPKYIADNGEGRILQVGEYGSHKATVSLAELRLHGWGKRWRFYSSFSQDPGDLHLRADDGGYILYARQDGRWVLGGSDVAAEGGKIVGPVRIEGDLIVDGQIIN